MILLSMVLFQKRELTEFWGKLGELCEKLGEVLSCHCNVERGNVSPTKPGLSPEASHERKSAIFYNMMFHCRFPNSLRHAVCKEWRRRTDGKED